MRESASFSDFVAYPIGGPTSEIAEEGSNPVSAGGFTYTGFTEETSVVVIPVTDGGSTLGTPATVYSGPDSAFGLRLAVAGSNVYALFGVHTADGDKLMLAASRDHGATWHAPTDFGSFTDLPQLSADGHRVHVIYAEGDTGTVVERNSDHSGRTFSDPQVLGDSGREVVIQSHGQDVYVAWEDTDAGEPVGVMVGASHDGGETFTVNFLSTGPERAHEPIIWLNAATGLLSMVWRTDTPAAGYYLQSHDGISWSDPLLIDSGSRQFMVADDGSNIYIAYLKEFNIDGVDDWQTYLAISTDGGTSFSTQNLGGPSGITKIVDDIYRPALWAGGDRFSLTGIKADGVYLWSGRPGHIGAPLHLGDGDTAAPWRNTTAWQGLDGVEFAYETKGPAPSEVHHQAGDDLFIDHTGAVHLASLTAGDLIMDLGTALASDMHGDLYAFGHCLV